ncbi:MAG: toll/interleukin-1 receptor domain-containing protein [Candidatus Korobacteraceae bacterium]
MRCEVFMSYTSVKDLFGAVGEFRDHLENELRKKTGNISLTVFQDKRGLHGGDKWEAILTDEIASAKLLLILLSPTWLRSEWCRKEYRLYVSGSTGVSTSRTVVPLVWDKISDTAAETEEEKSILAELKDRQILTWDSLQYEDWKSPAPNKAAGMLAEELTLKLGRG